MNKYHKFYPLGVQNWNYISPFHKRPSWDKYFLDIAKDVAKRSHDAQTHHGCVIVKDSRIIATGFNGFPPSSPDDIIPNIREDGKKYPFINHAEINAIFSCAKNGISLNGAKIYTTGKSCCNCAKALVSVGIFEWIFGDIGHVSTTEENLLYDFWVETFNVKTKQYAS